MKTFVFLLLLFFERCWGQSSYTWVWGRYQLGPSLMTTPKASAYQLCSGAIAEEVVVKRIEYSGVVSQSTTCYGEPSSLPVDYDTSTSYRHKEFNMLIVLHDSFDAIEAGGENLTIDVRIGVPTGHCMYEMYTVDSLNRSHLHNASPLLYYSDIQPLERTSSHVNAVKEQTLHEDLNSSYYNKVTEEWTTNGDHMTFHSAQRIVQFGDSDVKDGHVQWLVNTVHTDKYTEVLFNPITVTRPAKQCLVRFYGQSWPQIVSAMAYTIYVETVFGECNVDVMNLDLVLHGESSLVVSSYDITGKKLSFEKVDGGIMATRIDRLFVDQKIEINIFYDIPAAGGMGFGTKDAAVVGDLYWADHNGVKQHKNIVVNLSKTNAPWNSRFRAGSHENTTTSRQTFDANIEFHCSKPSGNQIAPCYRLTKDSGAIQYLSPFLVQVVGCSSNYCTAVYGRTQRGGLAKFTPAGETVLLSNKHWQELLDSGTVLTTT